MGGSRDTCGLCSLEEQPSRPGRCISISPPSPFQLDDSILGVVQTLVDASTGEPVRGFHELEDGGTYVACGKKSFKQLDYGSVPDYKERRASKGPEPMPKAASRRLSKKLGA